MRDIDVLKLQVVAAGSTDCKYNVSPTLLTKLIRDDNSEFIARWQVLAATASPRLHNQAYLRTKEDP
jgi:hypothetical protein